LSIRLIVTADDFGRAEPINDAVERAHRDGILTTASLMVTGAACADAVERARRNPKLGVGLHLTLVDGKPALPPEQVPALVDDQGLFTKELVKLGTRIFLSPSARRQLKAEMRAQFELFRATGLALDHVDSHHHYHLHPTVTQVLVPLAREYGAKGLRIPHEPTKLTVGGLFHLRRVGIMRRLARAAGLVTNDVMLGARHSGAMDAAAQLDYLERMGQGLTEMYCHPATGPWVEARPMPASYRPVDEFRGLTDPRVVEMVKSRNIKLTTFTEEAAA
jgi:hopanoid biosynthesis associated protein HpnK